MLLFLVLLIQWRVIACTSSPTLEDNMLSTDEEALSDLINSYRGQPEQEIALNLPTDEDALNEIKPMLQSGNPFYYTGSTGRFISSSFPEIDSRGFHESVFDDLDDLYPVSRRGKRYDSSTMDDRSIFTRGFVLFHPTRVFYKSYEDAAVPSSFHFRGKRSLRNGLFPKLKNVSASRTLSTDHTSRYRNSHLSNTPSAYGNHSLKSTTTVNVDRAHDVTAKHTPYPKNETVQEMRQKRAVTESNLSNFNNPGMTEDRYHSDVFRPSNEFETERNQKGETDSIDLSTFGTTDLNNVFVNDILDHGPYFDVINKRVPEIDKGGFHNDVFHNNFGNFHTLKRAPEMGQSGFHGDIFHKSFGDFNTLKRAPEMSQIGFHNDVFHNSFGNFETLRKRKPAVDTKNFNHDAFNRDFGHFDTLRKRKRKPASNAGRDDFSSDTALFDRDFGNFYPGKRRPNAGAVNGDAFHSNFGIFETLKKRRPEGELIGDAFHRGFGNFDTMKRAPSADDFDGEIFRDQQLGNFNNLKRSAVTWLEPRSQGEFNNYVEIFNKVRPHRFDRLQQYLFKIQPQGGTNYEKFRTFFRNYALLNKFDDMPKRLKTSETSFNTLQNNSSYTQ